MSKEKFFNQHTGELVKIDLFDNNWIVARLHCVDRGVAITSQGGHILDKCQLILIPFDELTERDAKVIKAGVDNPPDSLTFDPQVVKTSVAVDTLRSLGYCFFFMGKDPFEEKWAISKLPSVASFTSF